MIDAILEGDSKVPRKQRHTAKRIFERLRDEHGFDGQHTIFKDYVRERGRREQEMFVPLSHAPDHGQCDFGEAVAIVGGVERKVHYFVLDLPHGDGCFVKAYSAESTEAFLDGHVSAFAFLGGAPRASCTTYEAGGGQDTGRRAPPAHEGVHRVAVPLPVRGPVRTTRQG